MMQVFGAKMKSDAWLELVEDGTADTVEGGAIKHDPDEWFADRYRGQAIPGIKSVKLTAREIKELERLEALEDENENNDDVCV